MNYFFLLKVLSQATEIPDAVEFYFKADPYVL